MDRTSFGASSSVGGGADVMASELERRQHTYVRREREYKSKIDLLEAELAKAKTSTTQSVADVEAEKHMSKLRDLHGTIVTNIEHVQEQTARILQEQERDLLRAFRARIFDLQTELEKEKARAEDGAAVWIEKNRQLQKELEWAKEMADRLDRHNQSLMRETARLTTQYKTQEDDREYLIKQLVAAKKDNARLRQELTRSREDMGVLQSEIEDLRMRAAMPKGPGDSTAQDTLIGGSLPPAADSIDTDVSAMLAGPSSTIAAGTPGSSQITTAEEARYRDIIMRLKKLLDAERKAARQLRSQLTAELAARTEAEMFLRRAIEDARVEIDRKRQAVMGPVSPRARSPAAVERGHFSETGPSDAYAAISKENREQILASLLAQDHVLTALQRIAFPAATDAPPSPISSDSLPSPSLAGARKVDHFPVPPPSSAAPSPAGATARGSTADRFKTSTLGRAGGNVAYGAPAAAARPTAGGASPRPSPALVGALASAGAKK